MGFHQCRNQRTINVKFWFLYLPYPNVPIRVYIVDITYILGFYSFLKIYELTIFHIFIWFCIIFNSLLIILKKSIVNHENIIVISFPYIKYSFPLNIIKKNSGITS